MPTAHDDGVALHYELSGPADAEPVVAIQGLGYGRWMWRWLCDRLADDYRLVLPDNHGTGQSDAPAGPYAIAEMAADVEAVLADAGIERAHVVGASMGGTIAQQYALEFDRAATLSLLCTTHGGEEAVPMPEETAERIFEVPEGADERATIRHRMEPAVSGAFAEFEPADVERILDWRREQDAGDAAREAQAAAVRAFDASDRVGSIELPVLLLHGSDDCVVPVENARLLDEKLPDSRLSVVDGGPHLFFLEEPDLVADRIRTFVAANPLEGADEEDGTEEDGTEVR